MCAFSLGTETDGSVSKKPLEIFNVYLIPNTQIIYPSDRHAVVGIKPTVDLASAKGVIPEAPSLDSIGTIGRTVEDATHALDAIIGNYQPTKY